MATSTNFSPVAYIDSFRPRFIANMMSRFSSVSKEEIEDLFQDSCIIVFENFQAGKANPTSGKGNVEGNWWNYFVSVGFRQMNKRLRGGANLSSFENLTDDGKTDSLTLLADESAYFYGDIDEKAEEEERYTFIEKTLESMPANVSGIVTDKYLNGMRDSEIASRRSYANANTVKAKRSQVLRNIRKQWELKPVA